MSWRNIRVALHAFVDESFRSDYTMVAAAVRVSDLDAARKMFRQLAKSNRVHMAKESPRRRREILSRLGSSGLVRATVVTAELGSSSSQRAARDACFAELVPRVVTAGVDRLIVESCDQDARDRAAIGRSLNDAGLTGRLTYLFQRPTDEVLLAAADVVAWAYGARGEWRRRVAPVVQSVTTCPSSALSPADSPSGELPGSLPRAITLGTPTIPLHAGTSTTALQLRSANVKSR